MPWKERSVVEERVKFVLRRESGESLSELCREYGTKAIGFEWLQDESRRPHTSPHRTPPEVEALVVAAKEKRPTWGSKKIEKVLERQHPGIKISARCTIDDILRRSGPVTPRRRRKLIPKYSEHLAESHSPNDVWCVDFKGQFRLGNGKLCYPLTITDHFSRYLIAHVARGHPVCRRDASGAEEEV